MCGTGKTRTGETDKRGNQRGGSRPLRKRGERWVAAVCSGVAPHNEGSNLASMEARLEWLQNFLPSNGLEGYNEMGASLVVGLGV